MDVTNCRSCGRLFNRLADERVCPECKRKLEDKFYNVKMYLEDHPKCPLEELATENDVTVKQLKQWVREERLVFSEDSPVGIECENCGAMIRCGRYCDACKSSLANTLASAYAKKPVEEDAPASKKKDGNRMRFLQNF